MDGQWVSAWLLRLDGWPATVIAKSISQSVSQSISQNIFQTFLKTLLEPSSTLSSIVISCVPSNLGILTVSPTFCQSKVEPFGIAFRHCYPTIYDNGDFWMLRIALHRSVACCLAVIAGLDPVYGMYVPSNTIIVPSILPAFVDRSPMTESKL